MSGSVRRSRLLSLDTCRGLLLFVNVAAISLLALWDRPADVHFPTDS